MSESEIYGREQSEPQEGARAIPLPLTLLFGAIACWGSYYYGAYAGPSQTSVAVVKTASVAPSSTASADGKKIFESRCASCHQRDGFGISGAFPPLDGSEWVSESPKPLVAIVLHGMNGEITVKGETFQGQMPSFKMLKDEEIAALATYVRSSWSNEAGPVEVSLVTEIREETSSRTAPWNGEKELREYLGDKAP